MSAAEHQSRNVSSQSEKQSLKGPPQRPSLLQPPARPASPPAEPQADVDVAQKPHQPTSPPESPALATSEEVDDQVAKATFKNHPIAPPSEPMQYRAIGLVRGTYKPSEEQLNRGNILSDDGALIDSVLLGRVTSLIKKHIDLNSSHLWVVYPRTRQATEDIETENTDNTSGALHLQIVGVWEPETLGLPGENPKTSDDSDQELSSEDDVDAEVADAEIADSIADTESQDDVDADIADSVVNSDREETHDEPALTTEVPSDNYFSIRGEILNYDEDDQKILVKIVQGSKRSGKPPKAFKLHVSGKISGKTVGYFWELDVERQSEDLVLTEGRSIGIVPPKKKKKRKFPSTRKGRRPSYDSGPKPKPSRSKDKPRIRPSAPVKSNPL